MANNVTQAELDRVKADEWGNSMSKDFVIRIDIPTSDLEKVVQKYVGQRIWEMDSWNGGADLKKRIKMLLDARVEEILQEYLAAQGGEMLTKLVEKEVERRVTYKMSRLPKPKPSLPLLGDID